MLRQPRTTRDPRPPRHTLGRSEYGSARTSVATALRPTSSCCPTASTSGASSRTPWFRCWNVLAASGSTSPGARGRTSLSLPSRRWTLRSARARGRELDAVVFEGRADDAFEVRVGDDRRRSRQAPHGLGDRAAHLPRSTHHSCRASRSSRSGEVAAQSVSTDSSTPTGANSASRSMLSAIARRSGSPSSSVSERGQSASTARR